MYSKRVKVDLTGLGRSRSCANHQRIIHRRKDDVLSVEEL
jgi:hypothetical protein